MDAQTRRDINNALSDQKTIEQLSSSGKAAQDRRKDAKRLREEKKEQEKAGEGDNGKTQSKS